MYQEQIQPNNPQSDFSMYSKYYQRAFKIIEESNEEKSGGFNWAAFLGGSFWALFKGAWLSAIVSGIGTATASAGTVTSIIANSDKVRLNDSDEGKKKEKNLNLASNILAGVTMGTSGASTVLSATAIAKAKKDSEMAEKCESAL